MTPTLMVQQAKPAPPRSRTWCRLVVVTTAFLLLMSACNGGLRPTLVENVAPTPEPPLELEIDPAPAGTPPLPVVTADFPLEASVDDALLAWASDRNIPYVDACALTTPSAGQLCDSPTLRDTVRLLGPSSTEVWYVVTVLKTDSFDFGVGYRVSSVVIAGQ